VGSTAARLGVQAVEFLVHGPEDFVDELADRAEPVILRNSLLQGHVTEHSGLLLIVSSDETIIA
jgi:hypothetical protein